jgi:CubicO group peptidase (beta-lactamase class C family)
MKPSCVALCIALVITGSSSLSACSQTRVARSPERKVDALFDQWNRSDSPGCAVGISRNGVVLYEHGYGMANLELRVPITADTVFALASISKSFTAMSVALAAEHGRLSLDDEVQKYIPEWVDRDDHITIRHLLTHTAGLRDGFTLLGWAPPSEKEGDVNDVLFRMLARQRGLNFPPGTEYQYDNGGYNLLASILKRATGQSLRAFADANIFKPLGMTHSYFENDPARASGYSRDANGWHVNGESGDVVGNSGMYSTVGDVLRWESNFDDARVGTPPMLAAMQKPTTLKNGQTSSYGFGLDTGQYRGVPTVEHAGADKGIATSAVRFPNQHFAVVVLCNEDNVAMGGRARVNTDVLTNGIADIYLADVLGPPAASTKAGPPGPTTLAPADFAEKIGLYRFEGRDLPMLITDNHGALMVRSYYLSDIDFELVPVGTNRFLLQNAVPLEFVPASGGQPQKWLWGEGNAQLVLRPVTQAMSSADVQSFVGEYRSDELGATYTVEARDAALTMRGPNVAITPFAKDVFVGDVVGVVRFSRDQRGAVTGFTVNRDAARGVRFERVK